MKTEPLGLGDRLKRPGEALWKRGGRTRRAKAIADPWRRLVDLEAAVTALQLYLGNTKQDGAYPRCVNAMNRAMHRQRPEAAVNLEVASEHLGER